MLETEKGTKRRPGFSISDAAQAVGISRYTLRKAIDRQEVRVIDFGGLVLVPEKEVERLIKLFEE